MTVPAKKLLHPEVAPMVRAAEEACALAKKHGADAAEVVVRSGSELSVKVRKGEIELLQEASSKALGLRVFRDHRVALTYTSDFTPAAIDRFVADSVELARLAEPDELNELPDPSELATTFPDLDLYDEHALSVDAKHAIERCRVGEAAARAASEKITNTDGASYSRVVGAGALATTGGFAAGSRSSYQSLVVEPMCEDKDGKLRNGYWWTGHRFLDQLEDAEAVGREATRRTIAKLGADKIDTGELPIVFDPDAGRSILGLILGVASGGAIYRKSSYLVDREGSDVASKLVHLTDDPLIKRGPGSRPYDGDGLASRKNIIVDDGVLKTYLLDVYSARKLGRKSNGCASRGVGGSPHVSSSNFVMRAGTTPKADLLKGITRGLYVNSMMGFGFNAVTGDFSRGAEGFLIENGKLGRPVGEVTISANLDDILKRIDAVGDDLDSRSSTICPSFRVSRMTVAGR
jgi:PmbA protein